MPQEQIAVAINADTTGFNRGINGVINKLGGIGPAALAGATVAAGAAVAGFVAKSIAEFEVLDAGVRKVMTLWPDATESTFNEIAEMARKGSREFGIPVNEVLDGIYDALGSGVPPENLFSFISTSAEAAIGGATNLQSTVDTLTTAINSYGTANLSAQEASDILFTAVDKGKISWDDFGSSLANVLPMAASANVPLTDVGAALAAMTAQGWKAGSASTSLRAIIAELRDPTSDVAKLFEQIAGQSFPEFMKQGGTVEEAMRMIAAESAATGVSVDSHFTRIEAKSGVLALATGEGAVLFGEAMQAMDESAGATQAAYQIMADSITNNKNRIRQEFDNLASEVGQKLMPAIDKALSFTANTIMPALRTAVLTGMDAIGVAFNFVRDKVIPPLKEAFEKMRAVIEPIMATITSRVDEARGGIENAFGLIVDAWDSDLKPAIDTMRPLFEETFNTIQSVIENVMSVATGILQTFAGMLDEDIMERVGGVLTSLGEAFGALLEAVQAVFNGIKLAWEEILKPLFEGLEPLIDGVIDAVLIILQTLLDSATHIFGAISDLLRGDFRGAWEETKEFIVTLVTGLVDALLSIFQGLWDSIAEGMRMALNGIISAVNGVIARINGALQIEIPDINFTIPNPLPGDNDFHVGAEIPDIDPPDIPSIPHLGEGGVVDSATLAIIGEAGPEAVVPLDRLNSMGGDITVLVELDGQVIAESTMRNMPGVLRLQGV